MQKSRKLRVYGKIKFCPNSRYVAFINPQIQLQGDWLHNAGFSFGDSINVQVSKNQLIITKS